MQPAPCCTCACYPRSTGPQPVIQPSGPARASEREERARARARRESRERRERREREREKDLPAGPPPVLTRLRSHSKSERERNEGGGEGKSCSPHPRERLRRQLTTIDTRLQEPAGPARRWASRGGVAPRKGGRRRATRSPSIPPAQGIGTGDGAEAPTQGRPGPIRGQTRARCGRSMQRPRLSRPATAAGATPPKRPQHCRPASRA
jgi:hypothetical protein